MIEDIELDKQIDPDQLDVEWLDQSNLFYKYSSALNEAISVREEKKLLVERKKKGLDTLKSELELEIRRDPDAFELDKVTESSVKAAILASEEHKKLLEEYFEACEEYNSALEEVNNLFTCVNTMQEKKTALENLVRLLGQQYFSTPVVPRDLPNEYQRKKQEKEKNQKAAKNKARKRMRKEDDGS